MCCYLLRQLSCLISNRFPENEEAMACHRQVHIITDTKERAYFIIKLESKVLLFLPTLSL